MSTVAPPTNLTPLAPDPRILQQLGLIAPPGPEPAAFSFPGITVPPAVAGDAPKPLAAIASPATAKARNPITARAPGTAAAGPIAAPATLVPPGASRGPSLAQIMQPQRIEAGAPPGGAGTDAVAAARNAEAAIQPPQYRGKLGVVERIADDFGRVLAPGLEARLGVGTGGYEQRLAQAEANTDRAEKENLEEASADANRDKPAEAQQKLDQASAKLTETERNDAAKLATAYRKMGLDPSGKPLPDEQLTADELERRKQAQATTAYKVAQTAVANAQQQLDEAKRAALADPSNPAYQLAVLKAKAALKNATTNQFRQGYLIAKLTMEGIEKDPALLSIYRAELGPEGSQLTDDQIAALTAQNPRDANGNPAGMSSQFAPTTVTRSRGQQAEEVMPLFDSAAQHITQLEPELGPLMGRWTDFMAGKIGADNPQYSQLRTELDLLKGAYSRFHLNTELGYKTFDDFLNAAQSPENLLASLAVMRGLAGRYVQAGQGFPETGQPQAKPQPGHAGGTTRMRAPNGQEQDIPADQVDYFKKLGATVVNHG